MHILLITITINIFMYIRKNLLKRNYARILNVIIRHII